MDHAARIEAQLRMDDRDPDEDDADDSEDGGE